MKSSNPSLLVEELKAAGFTLTAEGSRLRVAPADSLTDELRQSIKEHRAGIIALLEAESAPAVRSTIGCHPSPQRAARAKETAPAHVLRYMPALPARSSDARTISGHLFTHRNGSAVRRLWRLCSVLPIGTENMSRLQRSTDMAKSIRPILAMLKAQERADAIHLLKLIYTRVQEAQTALSDLDAESCRFALESAEGILFCLLPEADAR